MGGARWLRVVVFVFAGCAVGCERNGTTIQHPAIGPPLQYLTLVTQTEWTPDAKHEFVGLFSVRGLNQLLALHGIKSFEEFESKRRSLYEGIETSALVRQEQQVAPSNVDGTPADVVTATWRVGQIGSAQYRLARFVLVDNRIHDIQAVAGQRSTSLTPFSVVLGVAVIVFGLVVIPIRMRGGRVGSLGLVAWIVFGSLGWIAFRKIAEGGGVEQMFRDEHYRPNPNLQFDAGLPPKDGPYPGPARAALDDAARQLIDAEMVGLSATMTSANVSARPIAASFRARGLELGAKADAESCRQAAEALYRSARTMYQPITMVDLAYYMVCQAQGGVNPELNLLRANAILDLVPKFPSKDETPKSGEALQTRTAAVRILVLLVSRKADEVRSMKPLIEGKDDERALEAAFLLEPDVNKALLLVDELIRLSPNNAKYYRYKGLTASKAGQAGLAAASLTRAVAMNAAFDEAKLDLNALTQGGQVTAPTQLTARWAHEPEGSPFRGVGVFSDLVAPPNTIRAPAVTPERR